MKKISDRALETYRAEHDEDYRPKITIDRVPVDYLARAIDEWQASIEERLTTIGLGMVPGFFGAVVFASGSAPAVGTGGELLNASRYDPEPDE